MITIPFLFIQHPETKEIFKINTPFLFEKSGLIIKNTEAKDALNEFLNYIVCVPNIIENPQKILSSLVKKLEENLIIIKNNNFKYINNNDYCCFDEHIKELKKSCNNSENYQIDILNISSLNSENDFIITHINSFRILECIEAIMQQEYEKPYHLDDINIIKKAIYLNLELFNECHTQEEIFDLI